MSRRRGTLGGLNIHRAGAAGKPSRSGKVTLETPPTLSAAKAALAAAYRLAGFGSRAAALEVERIVKQIRARDRRAAA